VPVISFDCIAGPSDMVRDGENGFLIPLFDYKQFMEKLKLLMQDEELRNHFSKNACQSIQKFSVTEVGQQYYSFITENL
jgi:glycosyltransferase involved in cell wall biosynthesis